jgi:hypothetical protein
MAFVSAVCGRTLVNLHSVDNYFRGITPISNVNEITSTSDGRYVSLLSSDTRIESVRSGGICDAITVVTKSGKVITGSPDLRVLAYNREDKDCVEFVSISSLTPSYAVVGGTCNIHPGSITSSTSYRNDLSNIANLNYRQQIAVVLGSILHVCIPSISFSNNRNLFLNVSSFDIANTVSCVAGMAGCYSAIKEYRRHNSDKPPFTIYLSPMGNDSVFNIMLMEQYLSSTYQHYLNGRIKNQRKHSSVVGRDIHPVNTFYRHSNISGAYRALQDIEPDCWNIPPSIRDLIMSNYVSNIGSLRHNVTPIMYSEVISSVSSCKEMLHCLRLDHPMVFMGNGFILQHP